jgi:outer membrane protein
MRVVTLFIIFHIILNQLNAQQKLRLDDCIEIAYKSRVEIQNSAIEIQNAEYSLQQAKMDNTPTLNARYSHNHNYNAINSDLSGDFSGSMSLSGSFPLFEWLKYWKGIDLAENYLVEQNMQKSYQYFSVCKTTIEHFYSLLYIYENIKATKRHLAISDSIRQNTIALFEAGKIMQNDVEEANLQFIQNQKSLHIGMREYEIAYSNLINTLQINDSIEIDFEYYDTLSNSLLFNLPEYKDYLQQSISNNPYIKTLESKLKRQELNYAITKISNRPTLDINYSASTGYSEQLLNSGNINLNQNLENSFAGLVGVTLTIPIINRKEYRTNVLISENSIKIQENINNAEYLNLSNILNKQYIETSSLIQQQQISQLEIQSIEKILQNRFTLYINGKDNIFTVLSYKRQYNSVEKEYILLKFETMLQVELMKLFMNGKFVQD